MKFDVYTTVTDSIIAAIEAGQTGDKWVMPWSGSMSVAQNATTQKSYRGVNILALWAEQTIKGYNSNYWASYKQWASKGGQVRKGSKSTGIVYWSTIEDKKKKNEDGSPKKFMFAKYSLVFNADCVDGYELPVEPEKPGTAEQIETADKFILGTEAKISYEGTRAFYSPSSDSITIPPIEKFFDTETSTATESYYSTQLHELTHWTGANHRLERIKHKKFGDKDYAFEELVAELGAAMMCSTLGITASTRADHAQYIHNWLKGLKNDKKLIFTAASQSQKAVDFLEAL